MRANSSSTSSHPFTCLTVEFGNNSILFRGAPFFFVADGKVSVSVLKADVLGKVTLAFGHLGVGQIYVIYFLVRDFGE